MTKNVVDKISDYYKECPIRKCDIDLRKLKKYQALFKKINQVSQSYLFAMDYYRNEYFFVSDKIKRKLGVRSCSHEALLQSFQLHPSDHLIFDSICRARRFICSQAIEERKKYRLVNNFRICNESMQYMRVYVQHSILEMDKRGNIWLSLRKVDLDPDQEANKPALSFLQHVDNNEIIYSIHGTAENDSISEREREVLELISEGYVSKEIAEKLFISEYTVNNHRKSILKKLNANNASEAIKKAVKVGIIR